MHPGLNSIAVPRSQSFAHAMRDLQEFGCVPDIKRAITRERALDDIGDPSGTG